MAISSAANGHPNGNVSALEKPGTYDVCIVGAGPAGLMLRYMFFSESRRRMLAYILE